MDIDILLGPVFNDAHASKLAEVAAWLDQNKFPCTFSVYAGYGHFTVTPNPDGPKDWSWEVFHSYALDTVVCALAVRLNPLTQEDHMALDHHGHCPECNANWEGGSIFDTLRPQDWCKGMSDEELHKYIEQYYSPPYRFSRIIGVELPYDHPDHYDGVSYWMCPDCKHQFPRFGEKVKA